MTRATAMTALAGVLITLAVVGGFLALDRTVLHLYYNDDAAKPASDVAEIAATPTETTATGTDRDRSARVYDALAESHAELVAALDWALPFAARAKITLSQRVRDNHARVLFKAGEALRKAGAP